MIFSLYSLMQLVSVRIVFSINCLGYNQFVFQKIAEITNQQTNKQANFFNRLKCLQMPTFYWSIKESVPRNLSHYSFFPKQKGKFSRYICINPCHNSLTLYFFTANADCLVFH